MGAIDYLIKQGWNKEDAEMYIELQEQGMSPEQAFTSVRGGVKSEKEIPVEHVYEKSSKSREEEAYEEAESRLHKAKSKAVEVGKEAKEHISAMAGLAPREKTLKTAAGALLLAMKPKPKTKEELRREEEVKEAIHQGKLRRIGIEASRPKMSGYSAQVQRAPAKITYKRVMKPPRHVDMTQDDMGMGDVFINAPIIGSLGHRIQPVEKIYNIEPKTNIPSRGRVNVNVRAPARTPVSDNSSNFLVNVGSGVGTPMGGMRMGSGSAENLVGLGNVRSPVNVGVRPVSTKVSQGAKPETKFKGRRPKTQTKEPKINTKIIVKKMFWEF